jgi:hypothetical protein
MANAEEITNDRKRINPKSRARREVKYKPGELARGGGEYFGCYVR